MADVDASAVLMFTAATLLGTCFLLCLAVMTWVICRVRSDRRRCAAGCAGEETETPPPPPVYEETRAVFPFASPGRERPRPPSDEEEVLEGVAMTALDAGLVEVKSGEHYAPSWQDFGDVLVEEEDRRKAPETW